MPATINPIKILKYKKSRYNNGTIEASLLAAGLSPKTARHKANRNVGLAKVGEASIAEDIKKKINVDYVLSELERIKRLAEANKDYSTATRNMELLGKYLAMFTDKQEITQAEKEDNQFSLERLSRIKQSSTN